MGGTAAVPFEVSTIRVIGKNGTARRAVPPKARVVSRRAARRSARTASAGRDFQAMHNAIEILHTASSCAEDETKSRLQRTESERLPLSRRSWYALSLERVRECSHGQFQS